MINPYLQRQLLSIAVVLFVTLNLWAGYWGVALVGAWLAIGVRCWRRRGR